MAEKRGFVRRNRELFNSNTGPSHIYKKLKEIYFEAAKPMSCVEDVEKNRRRSNTLLLHVSN
jgi:hypothetical protein